jgi:hypothetical protein
MNYEQRFYGWYGVMELAQAYGVLLALHSVTRLAQAAFCFFLLLVLSGSLLHIAKVCRLLCTGQPCHALL